MRSDVELRSLIPCAAILDWPPERACALMEAELEALSSDIAAARDRARRVAAAGLDVRRHSGSPALTGERVALAGGQSVVIRAIESADAAELVRTFGRLSALSRFRRFLIRLDRLSERQVEFLTRIDHANHEALIAFDAETGDGVGVVRYLRNSPDPRSAGFAAVVVDAWQGQGLGRALLERLAARAQSNGVEILEGSTVAGNGAARRLGASTSLDARTGTLQLTIRSRSYSAHGADLVRLPAPAHARGLPVPVPSEAFAVGVDL